MSGGNESDEYSSEEESNYDEEDHAIPAHICCDASHLIVPDAPNCSPDFKIQEYCAKIREHRRMKTIHPSFYLPHVGLPTIRYLSRKGVIMMFSLVVVGASPIGGIGISQR